jgi:hypothetical protein
VEAGSVRRLTTEAQRHREDKEREKIERNRSGLFGVLAFGLLCAFVVNQDEQGKVDNPE